MAKKAPGARQGSGAPAIARPKPGHSTRAAQARRHPGAGNRGIAAGLDPPRLGETGENGDKRAEHSSGLAHALNCVTGSLSTPASQSPRAPIRTSGALFFLAGCAVTSELGGRVSLSTRNVAPIAEHKPKILMLFRLEGDSFRATGSPPHTSEPVEGAVPHTNRRPFSLAALNSARQRRHAKNNENDNHKGAQHPQMKFAKHWQPHTTNWKAFTMCIFRRNLLKLQRS